MNNLLNTLLVLGALLCVLAVAKLEGDDLHYCKTQTKTSFDICMHLHGM